MIQGLILNITIIIVDIMYRLVFYLKDGVKEAGFCIRLQVEPIQFGPMDRKAVPFRHN
jgi:hypothetical protein